MSKKLYDTLRMIQLILPDVLSLYAVLDTAFGWDTLPVVAKIVPIIISIIGHLCKSESDDYFSTRSIVTKIVPNDGEDESEGIE